MFTGLIEDVGVVASLSFRNDYTILTIQSRLADESMSIGDSIAIDGACLTVVSVKPETFVVEVSKETANRTIIERYGLQSKVNLERALKVGDRLGGHFVSGHVDNTGRVVQRQQEGDSLILAVGYDIKYDPLVASKGSITINGVSLTVNEVKKGWFNVNLIPHTLENTTLRMLTKDSVVNLEFDILARYISRVRETRDVCDIEINDLIEKGF